MALEGIRRRLAGILSDDDAADIQPNAAESVDQAQHVQIVRDAQIPAHLVLFNVGGVDDNDDFGHVLQVQQHADLAVRRKTRQYARGVEVVEKLSAEFQVQLVVKFFNALHNTCGLHFQILVVVKADFRHFPFPL